MNYYIIKKINLNIFYAIECDKKINYKKIFKKSVNYDYILNYYLNSIISNYKKSNYKQLNILINTIYKKCLVKNLIIKNEASLITDDLLEKILHINNRKITLPIRIDYLKEYSITSIVKEKDLDLVIKLIIIKIAIINYFLKL